MFHLTLWLFLGGENLFVGLSSAVSGALRFVLPRDLATHTKKVNHLFQRYQHTKN